MRDELLDCYNKELRFLREMGAEFAQKYPGVAKRVRFDSEEASDPHVERLIEAVAFLTGRIQLKLDDDFPELTEALLNILYPHYLAPIPSMSIAQFVLDPDQGKLTNGYHLPRKTSLESTRLVQDTNCQFRTCYPVTLWPLKITAVELKPLSPADSQGNWPMAMLKIAFRCLNSTRLAELTVLSGQRPHLIDHLRFYLDGEAQLVYSLYELLFRHTQRAELHPLATPNNKQEDGKAVPSPVPVQIKPVGFGDKEEEGLLPYPVRSFPAYRLLTEYFAFPEKFLFFDVEGIEAAARTGFGEQFELRVFLENVSPLPAPISEDTFLLGCTPIVNLFRQTANPLYLSQRQPEYRIVPDIYKPQAMEVYSVETVEAEDAQQQRAREFQPFYSFRHVNDEDEAACFWYATRRPSPRKEDAGTEVYLSLVDRNFNPHVPAQETLAVKLTCTNRDLPSRLPINVARRDQQGNLILARHESDFQIGGGAPLAFVRCLKRPTATLRPPIGRGGQWRLISHLALNHLSLVGQGDNETPEALREILLLYDFTNSLVTRRQISGISHIRSQRVVRQLRQLNPDLRIGADFIRGIQTTIEFDEEQYVGGGLLLFASVLERFLGLYAAVNSFNQLVVTTKQRQGVLKRWPPRMGTQTLL